MKLNDIYNKKSPIISFEVFPPKNDSDNEKCNNLFNELEILNQYNPSLISVTYGAGGSNKDTSFKIVEYLSKKNLEVMPHFTCVCSSKTQINSSINELKNLNIENILALRGDRPEDINVCHLDFKYANELVNYLKLHTNFSIAVAGYPEGHIDAPDLKTDIQNLKRKVDEGAEVIYTQMFFDNQKLIEYIEQVREIGITIPIVAGILPILSYKQFNKMLSLAKVSVPNKLLNKIEKYQDIKDDVKQIGINFASEQCSELLEKHIQGLHFYTLNKAYSVSKILDNLNIN